MGKRKIAFLGGDKREILVMQRLAEKEYELMAFAVPPTLLPSEIGFAESAQEALKGADAVILPVCGLGPDGYLANLLDDPVYVEKEDFALTKPEAALFCGVPGKVLPQLAAELSLRLISVMELPQVAEPLAAATAEGALAIAISMGEGMLAGSLCVIVGYGRIGRELALRLRALGAKVTVVNRGEERAAQASQDGFTVTDWTALSASCGQAEYVFNTAPALIFDKTLLQDLHRDVVLLDLASAPGGVDWSEAALQGIRAVQATGLPGKYSPRFAGEILAAVYEELLPSLWKEGRE